METKTPKWLDNVFVEKILNQNGVGNFVKVENFTVNNDVVKSGDAYASTILKVSVNYSSMKTKSGNLKFIIKLTSSKKNVLGDERTFKTEFDMYNTIREMEHMFLVGGEKIEFAPRMLYYNQEPEKILVLEDVSETKQFVLEDDRFDLEGTKLVATKLAKWHAVSYILDREQKSMENFDTGVFNLNNDGVDLICDNFKLFVEEIKTWDGYQKYATKCENLQYKFLKRAKEVYKKSTKDGYNVLNHGDFHYKNMMFKRLSESGKLTDVCFLDFQLSIWATPAIDLYYLLYMVASNETRINYEKEIIKHYHQEFEKSVRTLGNPPYIPTLNDVYCEMLRNKFMEVVIAVCFLPFSYVDNNETGDAVFGALDARKKMYQNPRFQENIKNLLPSFFYNGALD